MSIILKGINIPKSNFHDLQIGMDGSVWRHTGFGDYELMQNVKAIQIPEDHGDIKDVSKLPTTENWIEGEVSWYEETVVEYCDVLKAPTLLRAGE